MQSKAQSVDTYMSELPEERKAPMQRLREVFKANLPEGFTEEMSYGMIGYVVPHSIYPKGYHCSPELPLPFVNIASQKNFIAVYHMGIYSDENLLNWFVEEFPKHSKAKLDMGKSCIRFKKMDQIPYELLGELLTKMTVNQWIERYDSVLAKGKS
jgi:uncharacterized protein YdhG (YjbR/CyaY superfamily)